jgi:hypothetical protein
MLADSQFGGLLIALLLGGRSAISQDSWKLFTATGSYHMFVILGLHGQIEVTVDDNTACNLTVTSPVSSTAST